MADMASATPCSVFFATTILTCFLTSGLALSTAMARPAALSRGMSL